MDVPIISDDENNIIGKYSDSNDSDNQYKENDWNIDIKLEEKFMKKLIEDNYIYKSNLCPCGNKGIYEIIKYKYPDLTNIFYCQCYNKLCQKNFNYWIKQY